MKKTAHSWIAVAVALLASAVALPLAAQAPQPGQLRLDFKRLAKHATAVNQVTLSGSMLRNMAAQSKDPQARQVLGHLQGIYIHQFKFAQPGEYSPSDLGTISRQLASPRWHIMIQHQNATEHDWIAVQRNSEGIITALAVVHANPTSLAIVNLVGPLPNGLASLSALDSLGDLGGGHAGSSGTHPQLQSRPSDSPGTPHP